MTFREHLAKASQPGIAAAKRNWPPFLAIQVVAALIVATYYLQPWVRDALKSVAEAKVQGGVLFSFTAGLLAGGVVPEAAKLVSGRLRRFDGEWLKSMLFNSLVYGVVGVQVDLFYRLQTVMFGHGTDPLNLVIKTAVDMGIFSPFLCVPTAMAFFDWRAGGWNRVKELLTVQGWIDRILPAMIPCWVFWIPVLLCVYAMPTDLQFSMANLAEAAWSILFVFIATEMNSTPEPAAAA